MVVMGGNTDSEQVNNVTALNGKGDRKDCFNCGQDRERPRLQGINVLQGGRKFDQCGEIGHFKVVLERDISKFSAVGLYGQVRKVEQKISDSDKKTNKKRRW